MSTVKNITPYKKPKQPAVAPSTNNPFARKYSALDTVFILSFMLMCLVVGVSVALQLQGH